MKPYHQFKKDVVATLQQKVAARITELRRTMMLGEQADDEKKIAFTESPNDPAIKAIAAAIKGKDFGSWKSAIEKIGMFKKNDISSGFSPVPHVLVKHKGKKIAIVNKKYADNADVIVDGTIAVGYME
jgi:hypothetical protein